MSDYTDEKFVKILRHLATQLPAYWVVSCEGVIKSKKLKEKLTKSPFCDFVLYVGKKTLIKRELFEEYINRATEV